MNAYNFDHEFFQNDKGNRWMKRPQVFKNFEKKAPFTDRESYVKWRDEWRVAYKWLSQDIRNAKNGRSSKKNPDGYADALTRSRYGREYARSMMQMRMDAKDLSMRMRAERLSEAA